MGMPIALSLYPTVTCPLPARMRNLAFRSTLPDGLFKVGNLTCGIFSRIDNAKTVSFSAIKQEENALALFLHSVSAVPVELAAYCNLRRFY